MTNNVFLRITSAVAIAGAVHGAGSIVEVDEDLAVNLLHRGKAEVATDADAPDPAEFDAADAQAEPPAPPAPPANTKPDKRQHQARQAGQVSRD